MKGINMHLRGLLAVLIAVAVILTACQPYQYIGTQIDPAKPLSDLTFSKADGGTFKLSDTPDRTLLLFFGYTNCPDICPLTMAQLKLAMEKLGDKAAKVDVALVTVDPERDTPDRLTEYVTRFNPGFIGLIPQSQDALKDIAAELGIYYEIDTTTSDENYMVMHTSSILVIHNQSLVLVIPPDSKADDIASDLAHLVK
jgi:protein SCO1/2